MLVELVSFNQEMDFVGGNITNYITMRLPNGALVKALVTDDGARTLVQARTTAGPMPPVHERARIQPPAPQAPPPPSEGYDDDVPEGASIFGGDDEEEEEETPSAFWTPNGATPPTPTSRAAEPPTHPYAHHDAATQQRMYQEEQKKNKERAKRGPTVGRTVQKDDMGYPRVAAAGGIDTYEVVGGGGGVVDEDGVGQG